MNETLNWKVNPENPLEILGPWQPDVRGGTRCVIAKAYYGQHAPLIAAAPELFEALDGLLKRCSDAALDAVTTTPNFLAECQAAKAAIAKARAFGA